METTERLRAFEQACADTLQQHEQRASRFAQALQERAPLFLALIETANRLDRS